MSMSISKRKRETGLPFSLNNDKNSKKFCALKNEKNEVKFLSNMQTVTCNDSELDDIIEISPEEFTHFIDEYKLNSKIDAWSSEIIDYAYSFYKTHDEKNIDFKIAAEALNNANKNFELKVDSAYKKLELLKVIIPANIGNFRKRIRLNYDDFDDDYNDEDEDNYADGDYVPNKKKSKSKKVNDYIEKDDFTRCSKICKHFIGSSMTNDPLFRKFVKDSDDQSAKSLLLNIAYMKNNSNVVIDLLDLREISANIEKLDINNQVDPNISVKLEDEMDIDDPEKLERNEIQRSLKTLYANKFSFLNVDSLNICSAIPKLKKLLNKQNITIDDLNELENMNMIPEDKYTEAPIIDGDDENFNTNENNQTYINDSNGFVDDDIPEFDNQYDDEHVSDSSGSEFENDLVDFQKLNNHVKQYWKITRFHKRHNNSIVDTSDSNAQLSLQNTTTANINKNKIQSEKKRNCYMINFMDDLESTSDATLFKKISEKDLEKEINEIKKWKRNDTNIQNIRDWNVDSLYKLALKPRRLLRVSNRKSAITYPDQEFWSQKYKDFETPKIHKDKGDRDYDDEGDCEYEFLNDVLQRDQIRDESEPAFGIENFDDPFDNGEDLGVEVPVENIISNEKIMAHDLLMGNKKLRSIINRPKKVDIRLLKRNLWECTTNETEQHGCTDTKLSTVAKDTLTKYHGSDKTNISTSYLFICMLHLANEKNWKLTQTSNLSDLIIQQ